MTYTLRDAKEKLARFAGAYGGADLSHVINEALDTLSLTKSWQSMRKVMRFNVEGEFFALPQDCGRIIRAAVDGVPTQVRGQDFEFLSAGTGDFDYFEGTGLGILMVKREGIGPTMYQIPVNGGRLAAFSATPPTAGLVKVKIRTDDDEIVTVDVPCRSGFADDADPASVDAAHVTALTAVEILGVVLPSDASAYINLYSTDGTAFAFLSHMHPRVKVPEFTRYRLPGFSATTSDGEYRLLVECGLRFLPLIDDDEPIPLSSIRPLQYMLQSFYAMDCGEVRAADEYRARAEAELTRREDTENEKQGIVVLNPLYSGSNGEASTKWENV
jgi:hypothetical protein